MGRSLPLFLYFCLWPKAKDLGITRVVVGFFIWSMPYQLPPPCYPQFFKYFKSIYLSIYLAVFFLSIYPFPKYQYIIAADLGAGISPCCLFNTKDMKHCSIKFRQWLGSNHWPLVLEATAIPTELQPLPISMIICKR